jgi:F-type H+-transporting ATPase subunit epsilon
MAMSVHLDIVSAQEQIFSGWAESVSATGLLGEIGIMPGHAPLLTQLKPGQVRVVKQGGEQEIFYISGGMLEVQPHHVTVLADTAQRADSLDEAAVLEAKKRAEEALANRDADLDYSKAAAELARAIAQIRAIEKLREQLK